MAPIYSDDHPAIAAQEAWIAAHRLEYAREFFEDFRDYVNSGDIDPMLSLFTDVISARKRDLSHHQGGNV